MFLYYYISKVKVDKVNKVYVDSRCESNYSVSNSGFLKRS